MLRENHSTKQNAHFSLYNFGGWWGSKNRNRASNALSVIRYISFSKHGFYCVLSSLTVGERIGFITSGVKGVSPLIPPKLVLCSCPILESVYAVKKKSVLTSHNCFV
jgi:hypothetical protein